MLRDAAGIPLDQFAGLLAEPGVLGLGEVMNYPGVVRADDAVLEASVTGGTLRKRSGASCGGC
jgi:adenine deaminase